MVRNWTLECNLLLRGMRRNAKNPEIFKTQYIFRSRRHDISINISPLQSKHLRSSTRVSSTVPESRIQHGYSPSSLVHNWYLVDKFSRRLLSLLAPVFVIYNHLSRFGYHVEIVESGSYRRQRGTWRSRPKSCIVSTRMRNLWLC